jgi:hypothetical protein
MFVAVETYNSAPLLAVSNASISIGTFNTPRSGPQAVLRGVTELVEYLPAE